MKKWLIAGVGAAGLLISSVALARVDVGISIGVPGVVYPAPVYAAPAPVYIRGGGYWGGHRGHWRGPDRGYYHGRGGWHR